MRAFVNHGPDTKVWEEVPKPLLVADADSIVRADVTAICGSDLHILKEHARRAVAEDRERIARDLRDTVIQRIFAAGLDLHVTMGTLDDPDRTRDRIVSTLESLDQAIADLRTAIFSL